MGGEVVALEPADRSVWAVVRRCSRTSACTLSLLARVRGEWRPAETQPRIPGPEVILVPTDPVHAWILSYAPEAPVDDFLVGTFDGGRTWQELPAPCPRHYVVDVDMAAANPESLWVVCGSEPGAGSQRKNLLRSPDGGRHWERPLDAPYSGYSFRLVATSPETAWLVGIRTPLLGTRDGGRRWRVGVSREDDAGWAGLVFVDRRHGWAAYRYVVLRTEDGGRQWEPVPVLVAS